ncbi:hypothetical protein AYK61_22485 [Rhodococcus sp. SBT000017]|uniref:hypothetical protein n=1 Tax=Rhodococcus sp. SBT000017 TaxID=1803385 RepID=UPI000EF94500|nr:hypothetical protein [Rhodococcus sp. SBT000017]RMB71927.1 hypothetical protein AYK61_22485 [Rhodococcus sp. SBT000017]
MSGVNTLDSAVLTDAHWVELMPWLDGYVSQRAALLERLAPGTDWWLEDGPSETVVEDEVTLDNLLAGLAELFVAGHKDTLLADAVPALLQSLPIALMGLEARAATAVKRLTSASTLSGLLSHTVTDIFAVPGTSEQTVRDVVHGLLYCAVLRDPLGRLDEHNDGETAPVVTQLLDDLTELAVWRRIRGEIDRPLMSVEIDDDSPEAVQEVAARLESVTSRDFPDICAGDAVDEIENLISQLDGRESIALHQRLLAAEPISLGELSTKLHLSKPASGAIESRTKAKINAACGYGTAVGNLLASLRVEIQPVASMSRLVSVHPEIEQPVPSLGVPLWLVLDRLDDYFEVTDGWAAAPDVNGAQMRTRSILEDLESPNGVVPLDDLELLVTMPRSELEAWLGWCAIPVVHGSALTRTKTVVDAAVGVLEAVGQPRAASDIAVLVDSGKPAQAVHRALVGDDRSVLGSDGLWSLIAWADAVMPAAVDLLEDFEAADDGVVRRRRRERNGKTPEQTRRLYRIGLAWRYRIVVTADQLRGSGFALPAGVAVAVGCERGGTVELRSRLGAQMVRWTGAQPTSGTIRRFLRDLDAQPGDEVLLEFSPDRSFTVVRPETVPPDADPLRRALAAIGHPQPMSVADRHVTRVLADAIGLYGESRPRRLLREYETGSEEQVVDLLKEAWVHRVTADE